MMSSFDTYCNSFPNAQLARSITGVLERSTPMAARWLSTDIPTNSSSTCFTRSALTAIIALSS